MDLGARLVLLAAAIAVAVGIVVAQRVRHGRLRPERIATAIPADWSVPGAALTIVQLSSAVCTACARSARVWTAAASRRPEVAFREIDAEDHLDAVRELGVLTTPTTLVYDRSGALRGRISGAPTPVQAADLLDDTIGAPA